MKLDKALKKGITVQRAGWTSWITFPSSYAKVSLSKEDLLADDWIAEKTKVQVTSDDITDVIGDYYTAIGPDSEEEFLNALGLEAEDE